MFGRHERHHTFEHWNFDGLSSACALAGVERTGYCVGHVEPNNLVGNDRFDIGWRTVTRIALHPRQTGNGLDGVVDRCPARI